MTDAWPTDRPGYPGPSGAYVLRRKDGSEFPAWWSDGTGRWTFRGGATMRPEAIADRGTVSLVGPCLTPSEVAAAVQAEREACDATTYDLANVGIGGGPTACMISRAIRARGPTDALADALAQARREGMDLGLVWAAELAKNACLVPPDGGNPEPEEVAMCDEASRRILARIGSEPSDLDRVWFERRIAAAQEGGKS